ncbi:MAG: hypothetical protein AAFZ80_11615 [Cyanobacteria bacterium P01_A01_bin.105]
MSEPQSNNRYPGCVAVKLHLKPNEESPSSSNRFRWPRIKASTHAETVRVSLSMTFGDQTAIDIPRGQQLGLPGGRMTFGIRRGQLKLTLQNCTMPLEKVELVDSIQISQVKTTGSEECPIWIFESNEARSLLEGTLKEQLLGVLSVTTPPYEITAVFTVQGEDIQLSPGQLGGTQNIHRNKLAIIERGIVMKYLKPLVEAAPLCEWKGCHD